MKLKNRLLIAISLLGGIVLSSCLSYWGKDSYNSLDDLVINETAMDRTYHDYTENSYFKIDSTPSLGNPKLLVVPIWFSDSSAYISPNNKEDIRRDIYQAYFGNTGWYSVRSYYEKESRGNLSLGGTVSPWYECNKASSYFYTNNKATNNLVCEVVDWYFSLEDSEERTSFDFDTNGYLDGIMLIYASPDYVSLGKNNASNMWAYCYWLQDSSQQDRSKPGPNTFFWASYDFMYDEATSGKRTGRSSYARGDNSYCTIDTHTYIHEMGHCFGLEDYYDYSDNAYNPAGGFSMQDLNIGGHDPYSVLALGWSKAYIPTESGKITIHDFQSSHDLILLTDSFNASKSPFDEYLLLELYTPTDLNELDAKHSYMGKYPTGSFKPGIRLWHVDTRLVQVVGDSTINLTPKYDPRVGNVIFMMSNTYDDGTNNPYMTLLGKDYANYNLLQYIRNDTKETYKSNSMLSYRDLFLEGDTFTMEDYQDQFVRGTRLNSGANLGWSFKVISLSNTTATIAVKKA